MDRDTKNSLKNYEIPLGKILLTVFFISFVLILIFVVIISIISNSNFLDYFYSPQRILVLIGGSIAFFFFFLLGEGSEWGGIDTYLVKKWILKNVRCPICGNLFTICEYYPYTKTYRRYFRTIIYGHFFKRLYGVYCGHCKKSFYLEQKSPFSKVLKFTGQSHQVEIIEEQEQVSVEKFLDFFRLNKEKVIFFSIISIFFIIIFSIFKQFDYWEYGGYTLEEVDWPLIKVTPRYLLFFYGTIVLLSYLGSCGSFAWKRYRQNRKKGSMSIVLFTIAYYTVLFSFLHFFSERFFSDIIFLIAAAILVVGILFYLGMYFILFERKKKNSLQNP